MAWINCPDWLSAGIYLCLGWVIIVPAPIIFPNLSPWALTWVATGGLAYSLGAVIYVRKWPNPWPERFGFHEVWHLFVLAGAGAHFVFNYSFVAAPYSHF